MDKQQQRASRHPGFCSTDASPPGPGPRPGPFSPRRAVFMICARRGLMIVMVLAPLGLWGCAQEKNGAANTKIRDLAARNGKLEEDVRLATTTGEGLRRKLAQAEAQRADLAKRVEQLEGAVQERDDLRKHLESRTGERDTLHA